jgi:hypothetical protein
MKSFFMLYNQILVAEVYLWQNLALIPFWP